MPLLRIRKDRHEIAEVPFADFIRRTFPHMKGLFVYRHLHTQNFVVAVWKERKDHLAKEIMVLGPSLGKIDTGHVAELRRRLSGLAFLTKRRVNEIADQRESAIEYTRDMVNEDWNRTKRDRYGRH